MKSEPITSKLTLRNSEEIYWNRNLETSEQNVAFEVSVEVEFRRSNSFKNTRLLTIIGPLNHLYF